LLEATLTMKDDVEGFIATIRKISKI